MFNIDITPLFATKVTIAPPGADPQDFGATFEALPVSEFIAFDLGTEIGTRRFLERALTAVDDIVGDDGEAIADSVELRHRLINLSWARTPLVQAYLNGLSTAQAGN